MPMNAVLQVRMDAQTKQQAEALFKSRGSSPAEAVRRFLAKSVQLSSATLLDDMVSSSGKSQPTQLKRDASSLHGAGCLSRYADPKKRIQEAGAWAAAVAEKHHG